YMVSTGGLRRRKLEPCTRLTCWVEIRSHANAVREHAREREKSNVIFMGASRTETGTSPLEESYAHLARRYAAAVFYARFAKRLGQSAGRRAHSAHAARFRCVR